MKAFIERAPGEGALASPAVTAPFSKLGGWIRAHPLLFGAIVVGVAARIVFWAWPDRVIDDALITIKHAKNLVDGNGLTHHLGEDGPVHGFTSALSVLIPVPGEAIADGGGLAALRLASLAAFVATAIYADRICRVFGLGPWPTLLALGYLAIDENQIFFGMAGLETQVATAILLAGVYYVVVDDYPKAGLLLGLAPLARPDFLIWVVPAYTYLLLRDRDRALRAGLVSAAVLAPWVIFTTVYYGSPIPNTIVAKSQAFAPPIPSIGDLGGWGDLAVHTRDYTADFLNWLGPFVETGWVHSFPVPEFALNAVGWVLLGLAVVGVAVNRRRRGLLAAAAFVALWILYRGVFIGSGFFEWYGVPIAALIVVLAAIGLQQVANWRLPVAAVTAAVVVVAYAAQPLYLFPIEARIQHQIEEPVRDELGRYLGREAGEDDTIVSESSGYVGYYTNAKLLDWPGLTSTEVTDLMALQPGLADAGSGAAGLAAYVQPDWIVLRPGERDSFERGYPDVAAAYVTAREFVADDVSTSTGSLSVDNVDRAFIVLHRR